MKAAGSFSLDGISYEMVNIAGGSFRMGMSDSPLLATEHSATVRNFSIGKTEVTQSLWVAVMGSNPSLSVGDNLPVDNISWYDAQEFIAKLNALSGSHFRLPTEAEWECAAQKSKQLGLENMTDGVGEWCEDWYHSYGTNQADDAGYVKIVRGGPYSHKGWPSSTSFRGFMRPDEYNGYTGLRLAQDEL